jgi:hypothetical protein
MKRFKLSVSLMMVLALVLVFIGCAKPPVAEQQAAKAAMDAAVTAGADKYAAADLDAAKKIWAAAEAQVKDKKYKEAKQSYIDAKAAFEKAGAAVEAGKKAAMDEATAAVAAVAEAWKGVTAAAKGVEKKMKAQKDAFAADAITFADGLKSAQEMIATDAAAAKGKAGELKSIIDKWEAAIKELAAAPAAAPAKPAKADKKKKAKS